MFTGIIEELGRLRSRDPDGEITRLFFDAPVVTADAFVGASISVNGCCLTVVEIDADGGGWAADAVAETLGRTNLATLAVGDGVNLERPVRLADRLGGHLVQGHVDAVGTVVAAAPNLGVEAPAAVARYLVPKGSITVDGVSLTVVDIGDDVFSVAVIPHTAEVTTLGHRRPGDAVNLEVDVIAKYAERLLGAGAATPYDSLATERS
ncbi:MAG: riboflavin synthase [Actinomycetota bacterium]|nr:riboflavin synthase [Actinomycetota bacterium]